MAIVLLRTMILYCVIMFSLRLMGKRQLAQLQPGEFVVTILVSNIATLPLQDTDIPLIGGIIPIICLVSLEVIVSAITAKSHKFRRFCYGREMILMERGKINQKNMEKMRYTADDLMRILRSEGIFDPSDADFVIVHTDGSVGVYPLFDARPTTNKDLGVSSSDPDDEKIVQVVASEGNVNEIGLQALGLEEKWLEKIIHKKGRRIADIFMMTAKSEENYKIVWKEQTK